MTPLRLVSTAAALLLVCAHAVAAQEVRPEFQGDWVPEAANCESPLRLRVGAATLTLINGTDMETWGNLGLPASFFGPSYTGVVSVALPDFDADQPFTVFFNADERLGVTIVNIYREIQNPPNARVAAIQAAAKALASRFSLNDLPLKKC